jgi:hypothetical protein
MTWRRNIQLGMMTLAVGTLGFAVIKQTQNFNYQDLEQQLLRTHADTDCNGSLSNNELQKFRTDAYPGLFFGAPTPGTNYIPLPTRNGDSVGQKELLELLRAYESSHPAVCE